MNKVLSVVVCALLCLPAVPRAHAADAKAELQDLVTKVMTKLQANQNSAADLAPELKGFDDLLAEHRGEKTDDVAKILLLKATLYEEVLKDDASATAALQKLRTDFPDTAPAKQADAIISQMAAQRAAEETQSRLVVGAPFPDFHETDLDGKPLSVASYKGKIVLVDFWATWCGPCVRELPNVLKTYQQDHGKGFEIIGVSLDEDKDKLTGFLKDKQVPWAQYFDGKGWQNKLASTYGIQSIPATFLLGKDGKIIGKDLRGEELASAVSTALAAP